MALDKAVTIDTRAILQEKYKSYIYLRATPSDEKENLAAGTKCHSPRLKLETEKTILRFPFSSDVLFFLEMALCPRPAAWHLEIMLSGFIYFLYEFVISSDICYHYFLLFLP